MAQLLHDVRIDAEKDAGLLGRDPSAIGEPREDERQAILDAAELAVVHVRMESRPRPFARRPAKEPEGVRCAVAPRI